MSDVCVPHHDWFNNVLTFGLCLGLVGSYLPQHIRIIQAKSSEGISVAFLFLGVGSTTSSMFNMITLQVPIVKCCRVVSFGSCLEMTAGVIQMTLQSICFSLIFVLYMIYYPQYMKYVDGSSEEERLLAPSQLKQPVKTRNWQLSIILAWAAALHFSLAALITTYLLLTIPDMPTGVQSPTVQAWATFLGVSSVIMAMIQYTPQLIHTFRLKHVGALSIPMMIIQTPGGILMVISVALRPGTNWTSWITFLVSAMLQGCLLFMCIIWKIRQRRLNVDDFGNPLAPLALPSDEEISELPAPQPFVLEDSLSSPELVITPFDDPVFTRQDTLHPTEGASPLVGLGNNEETPLLRRRDGPTGIQGKTKPRGWSAWFGR